MKTVPFSHSSPHGAGVLLEIDTPLVRVRRGIQFVKTRNVSNWRERLKENSVSLDVKSARFNPLSIFFKKEYHVVLFDDLDQECFDGTLSQVIIDNGFGENPDIPDDAKALNAIWRKIWQEAF